MIFVLNAIIDQIIVQNALFKHQMYLAFVVMMTYVLDVLELNLIIHNVKGIALYLNMLLFVINLI